jgi:L-threonylcarbamoyladenylate synthase
VLSLAEDHPVLLRHGMISVEKLEEVVGAIEVRTESRSSANSAPGQRRQHYQPRTPLHIGGPLPKGRGAYLWWSEPEPASRAVQMPGNPAEYAAILYTTLHELDRQNLNWIAVEPLPDVPEWAAIADRLARASVR